MKIIKRSGSEDIFDISKIEAAIRKANDSVIDYEKLGDEQDSGDSYPMLRSSLREYEALPECGGDSGYGGEPDHESACV